VEAPAPLKCAWRGIMLLRTLAREGHMTVTIGRRELLAVLGSAAAGPAALRRPAPRPRWRNGQP
jgi:hypothetical protein